ncbi:uncharacterized protein METZ01_LOCUS367253 [marine metagenome]|uniref:Uncharacterized protein n=1 Tax=marine metagenome TaxID=408172 RepID=A0A382SWV4_9ZZZZ
MSFKNGTKINRSTQTSSAPLWPCQSISQVTDEVLYTGLVEMQELPELDEWGGGGKTQAPSIDT